jgi:hypothetical protein
VVGPVRPANLMQNTLYIKKTSFGDITTSMAMDKCCKGNHFHMYQRSEMMHFILYYRKLFWECSLQDQNNILTGIAQQRGVGRPSRKFEYNVYGLKLCSSAILMFLGITRKRWLRYSDLEHPEKGLRKTRSFPTPKRNTLIGWMEAYFSLRGGAGGDWQPNVNELHLSFTGKNSLFQEFRGDLITLHGYAADEVPSYTYFISMMHTHFKFVKIGGYKEFAKCDRCSHLDLKMAHTKSKAKIKRYLNLKAKHKVVYMAEKRKYWKHIFKSIQSPGRYMCLIGDGMENAKSAIPWWVQPPYSFNKCATAGFGVQGIINHAHNPKTLAFICPDVIKKGANFTIEWLLRSLTMVNSNQFFYICNCANYFIFRHLLSFELGKKQLLKFFICKLITVPRKLKIVLLSFFCLCLFRYVFFVL